jgi:hypothetical protein
VSVAPAMPTPELDLSAWPVVAVRVPDVDDQAELGALLDAVSAAVARGGAFGLLVACPVPLGDVRAGGEALRVLRRRRAEVGTWCRGVVYVMPAPIVARFAAGDRTAARLLWGCEVEAVHDEAAARAWLRGRLDELPGAGD